MDKYAGPTFIPEGEFIVADLKKTVKAKERRINLGHLKHTEFICIVCGKLVIMEIQYITNWHRKINGKYTIVCREHSGREIMDAQRRLNGKRDD